MIVTMLYEIWSGPDKDYYLELETKAKEVRDWLDEVSITGTTAEYNGKRTEMETLMTKLGVR